MRYWKDKTVQGDAVSSYTIDHELSVGLFAVSYLATASDGRKVFLKQYKSPSRLVPWYEGYKKYQSDLKALIAENAQLVDRSYGFIDLFERDGALIQVFEFIENGKDLREYLDEGCVDAKTKYAFASLFLYTLKLFHDAGIVHTDLKPENVFLMPVDTDLGFSLKLIDFDFTVIEGKTAPWHGHMNYCGTPRYMSPEHLTGKVPGKKSDAFTAAIICYELLAQGHPFPADAGEYAEAVKNRRAPAPEFDAEPTPEVKRFGELLKRALSPDAEERPTVGELHKALIDAKGGFTEGGSRGTGGLHSCGYRGEPDANDKCPACGGAWFPRFSLIGSAGTVKSHIGLTFGNRNLAGVIGDDAQYATSAQFKVFLRDGRWFAALADGKVANPPLLNGTPLTAEPRALSNGDCIFAAAKRDDPEGVRKGEMKVELS